MSMLYICTVNISQTYIKLMNIPSKTLKKWASLREEGDISLLAKETGKAESTIHQILRTGVAHVRDAQIINDFFKKRKKAVESVKIEDDGN